MIQVEPDMDLRGPTLIFNELPTLGSGSVVGDTLKDGMRDAVSAAARALDEDERGWRITIKSFSHGRFSDGNSASSVVAVGIMAALRGDTLMNTIALTGVVSPEGNLGPVGGLVQKLEAAAQAHMDTLLVPTGQAQTEEWDLIDLGLQRGITVIEIDTLSEAYEHMTGRLR